jgi:DNA-binding GntR family transcriptional regulator
MSDWSPDPRALFMRVVDDIEAQVREGSLRPGQRLPSARQIADHYQVSAMTAMRELHVRGVTYAEVGRGTFVRPDALPRLIATPPQHCSRCDQETAYTAHLAVVIGRCHQLADRLDTRPSADTAGIAADVRRLANLLAGGLMDHAGTLDRSDSRHRHD